MKSNNKIIIAEIGQNHNGDMSLAKELIVAAKESGADIAKFQLYDAPTLFPTNKPWFEYNCITQLTKEQLNDLSEFSRKVNIEFMASAFDVERVMWLEELGVRRHKVASRSIAQLDLLDAIASTKKPVIASLGMWGKSDFPNLPFQSVDFLYCVSKYPTQLEDLKLEAVDFSKFAGFSDHTIGITAACTALVLGARIIEKHFTIDKAMAGPDHSGSMTPDELLQLSTFRADFEKCM